MTKYNSELNDDKKVPTNEEVYDESSHLAVIMINFLWFIF